VASSIPRDASVFNMRVKRLDVPSAERKFLCEYCGNTNSTILKLHLHQHIRHNHPSTAEIFFCEYCGKTYPTIFNLYLHQHEEHSRCPSAKPEFNCEYCDRVYTRIFSPPKRIIKKNPNEPTRNPLAKCISTSNGRQDVLHNIPRDHCTRLKATVIAAEREVITVLAAIDGRKKKRGRKSNKEKAEAETLRIIQQRALRKRLLEIEEEGDPSPTTSMTLKLQFFRSRSPTHR